MLNVKLFDQIADHLGYYMLTHACCFPFFFSANFITTKNEITLKRLILTTCTGVERLQIYFIQLEHDILDSFEHGLQDCYRIQDPGSISIFCLHRDSATTTNLANVIPGTK